MLQYRSAGVFQFWGEGWKELKVGCVFEIEVRPIFDPDTGDGAPWIWNLTNLHFYDSQQTLDYYHATEHLTTPANLLYPSDPPAAQRWLTKHETRLLHGHADQISSTLAQAATGQTQRHKDLRTEADYFRTHQRRMQ